ncbi:helix-turn-helix domain-containing protein [Castellaniella sp. S9]|uniref:helix-turn-helix domain-containing protein n=1 Tax=Castellaniella sp. S9 TaxID=2993652 RepID=UPI003FA41E85
MMSTTPLERAVRDQLDRYFEDLGDSQPHNVMSMVTQCVERTVLLVALERTAGNQSRAADMLGITRGTLRKKLLSHGLSA